MKQDAVGTKGKINKAGAACTALCFCDLESMLRYDGAAVSMSF